MVIQCEYCMVTVPSEEAMEMHVKGKRHQRIVEVIEQREKNASFTVFTRGFKDDTTEDELRTYFTQFGEVANIFMGYKRLSLFALVEFAKEEYAQAAIAHERHELRGTPFSVKPRRVKKAPRRAVRAKVIQQKQKASWKAEREGKRCIAYYHDLISPRLAIAFSIEDQMRFLTDFLRMSDEEANVKQEICDMLQTALVKVFPACTIHQFGSSVNGFGVKGCDADIYLDFHEDEGDEPMEGTAAQKPKPAPKPPAEGNMETGNGEGQTEGPAEPEGPVKLPYHRDIPSLTKTEGPVLASDLLQMTANEKIKFVSRVLLEHAFGCANIMAIPSARCPLIKFIHEPTGIRCDLSINNKLALRNTRLLQLCSQFDDRVGLIVHCVRFWAKIKEIAGNHKPGPRLTNYALTLLVVSYLQNLENPILPSMSKLAEVAGREKVIIDGWDCSYLEELNTFAPTTNVESVEDLMKGFFHFYGKLDFSTVVMQPSSGTLMPIQEMIEKITAGEESLKIGVINVQDPFVLDHNITANVTEKMKAKISMEFRIAAFKSALWSTAEQAVETGDEFGLSLLLDCEIPEKLVTEVNNLRVMDEDNEDGNAFTVVLKVAQQPNEAFQNLQTPDFRLNWCFKVCLFVQRLLETILMFETEVTAQTITGDEPKDKVEEMETESKTKLPEESPRKRKMKQDTQTGAKKSRDDPSLTTTIVATGGKGWNYAFPPGSGRATNLHMELLCKACCRTWNGRKNLRKEVMADGELDGLELEKEISEQIIENVGFSEKYLLQFRIDIDAVVQTSKTAVMLKLEPTDGSKEFACFYPFFKTFVRRLVEKNLYEVW